MYDEYNSRVMSAVIGALIANGSLFREELVASLEAVAQHEEDPTILQLISILAKKLSESDEVEDQSPPPLRPALQVISGGKAADDGSDAKAFLAS